MRERLQRIRRACQQLGWRKAAVRAIEFSVSKIYTRYEDVIIERDLLEPIRPCDDERLLIRSLTREDRAAISLLRAQPAARAIRKLDQFLRHGYKGYCATIGNEIIGYGWCVDANVDPSKTHPQLKRYGIRLGDGDVHVFEFFVAQQHRELFSTIDFFSKFLSELRRFGYRRATGVVRATNMSARWIYQLTGWNTTKVYANRLLFSSLLFYNRGVCIRNGPWNSTHSFDYGQLLSLRWAQPQAADKSSQRDWDVVGAAKATIVQPPGRGSESSFV
jgi:hypothetical protein